jgi:hypothetical protein
MLISTLQAFEVSEHSADIDHPLTVSCVVEEDFSSSSLRRFAWKQKEEDLGTDPSRSRVSLHHGKEIYSPTLSNLSASTP